MGDLTKNFSRYEVACKCGKCSGLPEDPEALEYFMKELNWLQLVRDAYGMPINLSSGYRCPDYNASISTTGRTGPHTRGAFDVICSGIDAYLIVSAASRLGVGGIGVSQKGDWTKRFIHLDRDKSHHGIRPWIWSY